MGGQSRRRPIVAEPYKDVEREHSFDGLTEYDNRVPLWLHTLFVLSVLWSVWYVGHYLLGNGKLGVPAYEEERIQILEARAAAGGGIPDEEVLRQFSHVPERVAAGKEVFFGPGICASCHGQDGLGLTGVGPNLRDDRWLYGSDMSDLIQTMVEGRPGGMPSQTMLSEQQMINVAAFLADWNRTQKANGRGFSKEGEVEEKITY
jgi:cytochrome c oxidase cbb3-type subunit 3